MKRFSITTLFCLGLSCGAWAAPQAIYTTSGTVTNPLQIDAVTFVNYGTIAINTATVNSNFVQNPIGDGAFEEGIPFSTKDTVNFTNTSGGYMYGTNGFEFETITSTTVKSAGTFVNDGTIIGFDYPASPDTYSTTAGTTAIVSGSTPISGHLEVLATNISNGDNGNSATMAVGNAGLLKMTGNNVSSVNSALVAGAVSTGDDDQLFQFFAGNALASYNSTNSTLPLQRAAIGAFDPLDTTGGTVDEFGLNSFFVDPPDVYDLYWGNTPPNANPLDLSGFSPPYTTSVVTSFRESDGGTYGFGLPITPVPVWSTNVFVYTTDASNTYYNIAFVNTNFFDNNGQLDTNITATVGFTDGLYIQEGRGGTTNGGQEIYVRFSLPVFDVVSSSVVTNSIYLADIGSILTTNSMNYNASSADNFGRPNDFSITTTTPGAWASCFLANTNYDPNLIYEDGTYASKTVPFTVASYGVQIGRNPAELDGSFNFSNFLSFNSAIRFNGLTIANGPDYVIKPDPTNDYARIELTANQLDLTRARVRTEGMVILNATNLAGQPIASDWGQANANFGSSNGTLTISNLFPSSFSRLRGNIYAYCINWDNTVTNGITNYYHYHMLVVDQNLGGNFQSAIRNFALTASNAVTVQDPVYVINQSYFNTANLAFNNKTIFTQNAGSLTPANMPKLKNFLNNTNGNLICDNLLDIGYDATKIPTSPVNRKYTVLSVTNLGAMTATQPLFQSEFFENDGSILAESNGSIVIEAATLGLGLAQTNMPNILLADDNITLSAVAMGLVNSRITNGITGNQGQLTLQSTLSGQITDFAASDPSTNAALVNFWQVTDGFSLPVKPATGDLFGTEITTVATNFTIATHTWAGVDLGATSQGFADNMVIGHLKLSNQSTNAALRFTAAGVQNAMYVEYLELDPNSLSYSNYNSGLIIDPNMTIYFAACNVDPVKLETVYTNRLIWVPGFSGPNSTVAVPYTNVGNTNIFYCLMNSNVANSRIISSSDSGVPNSENQPYILNNPFTGVPAPCPGDNTSFKDFIVQKGISITNNITLQIAVHGSGTVTPNLKENQIVYNKSYALTATPAAGWVFSGWAADGLPAVTDTSSRILKFKLANSISATAIFSPKTFTLVKGTYHGLFMSTNTVPTLANSGSFNLSVTASGAFSGRLLMGATNYVFSSKFATNGAAQALAKHADQSLLVELQLDMTGESGQVTGYVESPGIQLLGDLAPLWTAHDAAPYAGKYTMVLTNHIASTNSGTNIAVSPQLGYSYGALAISKLGNLTVEGVLADGNPFSQSVPVSKTGSWPFYCYVPGGKDRVLGWVSFQGSEAFGYNMVATNVYWTKSPSRSSTGFSEAFNLLGSSYSSPGTNGSGLSLISPIVLVNGTDEFTVTNKGKFSYETNNLNLTIKPSDGIVSGRLEESGGFPSVKLNGVVLQNMDAAYGFFLGTNDASGSWLLESQ